MPVDNTPLIRKRMTDEAFYALVKKSVHKKCSVEGVALPGFPDEAFQKSTVGSAGEQALPEAYGFYRHIKQAAKNYDVPYSPDTMLLDFGVGWGRMLRFFMKDISAQHLYGVDVDPLMTKTCRQTGVAGDFHTIAPFAPTQFGDRTFDIIYAYSVFSHLAQPVADAWIAEFSRILKPGGIIVATTQARSFIDYCAQFRKSPPQSEWHEKLARSFVDEAASYAAYDAGEFLFSATGGGDSRPSSFYGEAMIPEASMHRHWSKHVLLREFQARTEFTVQSVFVLQRNSNS